MIRVHVLVHLKPDILDAESQAIAQAVVAAGHDTVANVRAGRSFHIQFNSKDRAVVEREAERLCREALANPLIETWEWTVEAR